MPDDLTITSHSSSTKRQIPDLHGGQEPEAAALAALAARRGQIVGQSAARVRAAAAEAEAEAAEAAAAPPIEDIESVEVRLPNGSVVLFGPPATPASIRVAQMLGPQASGLTISIATVLLYIQAIDDVPVRQIGNFQVDGQALLNRIGDDGLDLLSAVSQECWPGISRSALPIIKKNRRG